MTSYRDIILTNQELTGVVATRGPIASKTASPLVKERSISAPRAAEAIDVGRRLEFHKLVLHLMEVDDVAALGPLRITGTVVPKPGLLAPFPDLLGADGTPLGESTVVRNVLRPEPIVRANPPTLRGTVRGHVLRPDPAARANPILNQASAVSNTRTQVVGGTGRVLRVRPFPKHPGRTPMVLPLEVAYWTASEIVLEDDTMVVFNYPSRWIVIITPKLTVGENVVFTWEQPTFSTLQIPGRPQTPPAAGRSGLHGHDGRVGENGHTGAGGAEGADAPEIELVVKEMSGSPSFMLQGQEGQRGGQGGLGGMGGRGGDGKNWVPGSYLGSLSCTSGPGNGGNGGVGGRGGTGGPGGDGGNGGQVRVFAPQAVLQQYAAGLLIVSGEGQGGAGGEPGIRGAGGMIGHMGDDRDGKGCPTSSPRSNGSGGLPGQPGIPGPSGISGRRVEPSILFERITKAQFDQALLKPAILDVEPDSAKQGDRVTAIGLRFAPSDVIMIDSVECVTRFVSDTTLEFDVPACAGGIKAAAVRQIDGTISNNKAIVIMPWLSFAEQDGDRSTDPHHRFTPGALLRLHGSGFAPGMRVRVTDQEIPGATVLVEGSNSLTFSLVRPNSVKRNPVGEEATLQAVLRDGTVSNQIPIILDTFRMLVLGDSIQWGQGLDEATKIHKLVEAGQYERRGNIGIYKDVLAHSGAEIGANGPRERGINGEVPRSTPNLFQQVDLFTDDPDTVDLILMDGGANDVNVRNVLNPFGMSVDDLSTLIDESCGNRMTALLRSVVSKFKKARVVVTGYYQIISPDSDLKALTAFLIALGVIVGNSFAGAAGAGAAIGLGIVSIRQRDEINQRCFLFRDKSRTCLRSAVHSINQELGGGDRVIYVDPDFHADNAVLGADPWLFGVTLSLGALDPMREAREKACDAAGEGFQCKLASAGHPNEKGARQYAQRILAVV